jgi:hypothetical protein
MDDDFFRPSIPPETLDDEYGLILNSITEEDCEDHAKVLQFCAFSIEGGLGWPNRDYTNALGFLSRGYGCWLQDITAAIETAPLSPEAKRVWLVAFNGAKAVIEHFYIEQRRATPSLGMKPPSLQQ